MASHDPKIAKDIYETILHKYLAEGCKMTAKEIATQTKHSEATVRRYLNDGAGDLKEIANRESGRTSYSKAYRGMASGAHKVQVYTPSRELLRRLAARAVVSSVCERCGRDLLAGNKCVPCAQDAAAGRGPLASRSDGVAWDTSHAERFVFMLGEWDVTRAKRILAAAPRDVLLIDVAKLYGMAEFVDNMGRTDHGLDLNFPVICGTTDVKRGRYRKLERILLDGWHRVRAAEAIGVTQLPAVVLTEDETNEIRIR